MQTAKTWETKNIIKIMYGLKVETHMKVGTKNIFNPIKKMFKAFYLYIYYNNVIIFVKFK
jgi:hypothetical protein